MKIAVPYENGMVFQHFGHTAEFKFYEVENGQVTASEVVSTLYRYATVNMVELVHLLGAEKAAQAVRVFGEAFIRSMPTGKQNSFANRTLPDAVYVTLREDQPVNLCGAFEKPVRKSPEGYAEPSKTALKQYAQQVYACYADAPAQSFAVGIGLDELAPAMPLNQMLTALERAVKEKLPGNEV